MDLYRLYVNPEREFTVFCRAVLSRLSDMHRREAEAAKAGG